MNAKNINEKKPQKIAIALFSTSLLCLILVVLLSGNFYLNKKRQAVPPQHTEWTLSTDSEVSSVSNIDFIPPEQDHLNLNLIFEIEDREDIKVIDESCYDDCNKTFNVGKLQSSIKNKTLIFDFTQTIIDKIRQNYEYKRVVIKLPNKGWNIKCINDSVIPCKTIRHHSKQPINLTLTSNYGLDIFGNFDQLTLWQLSGRSHDIESGSVNNLTIYSPNAEIDISNTTVNHIDIHSDKKGYFRIDDLSLLERTTLQPLTDEEREKIIQLKPLSRCGQCSTDKHP